MGLFVHIDGQKVPISLRKNKQAKRLILRMNPKTDGVVITLPPYGDEQDALEMAEKHKVWIANQLVKKPDIHPLEHGSIILFKGEEVKVLHDEHRRGTVHFEQDQIIVCGKQDFFQRRLKDAIKKQARAEISHHAYPMAEQLGRKIKRIVMKDTVSRWGSCSHQGCLNFNWRLVLAPPHILRYVVAHEVSHLVHMNHSAAFWSVVEQLHPQYRRDQSWLKSQGTRLQSINFD